jgi:hypothetical protein
MARQTVTELETKTRNRKLLLHRFFDRLHVVG